ncbi:CapA family protein [Antribacter sp. KLBMP9083]|uniref:CapA family protein n=1 Tax=Antribacter soli TaxID=2910976 RepID=A0AA41QGD6_9MICO|nr:CapA family protein [Antribacter soli]MCF4122973.1 CapA family protein [Antribacter soli]
MAHVRRSGPWDRGAAAAALVIGMLTGIALTSAACGPAPADASSASTTPEPSRQPMPDLTTPAASPAAQTAPGGAGPGPAPQQVPSPPTERPATFTILAGGDVLPHAPVTTSASRGGVLDFSPLLAGIDAWVRGADLALCHLEAPVAPPGTAASGYPLFGAPPQLVTDLQEQGWDGCSTASNHAVDRGFGGVTATLDALDAAGMGHTGTARDAVEQAQPQLYVLERRGRQLTVAHLASTYGLNGLQIPEEAPWAVDLTDVNRLVAQASAARAAGADLVVVSLHEGVEYVQDPTARQREVAGLLAASGQVDLLVGHHAHVPQPVEHLPGGPGDGGMWVAYGLGNLISNQGKDCCDPRTSSGLLLTVTVTQEPRGPARVTGAGWTATTVDLRAGHRLRTIADALADPASGTLSKEELIRRQDLVRAAAGTQAPELVAPPTPTGDPPVVTRSP